MPDADPLLYRLAGPADAAALAALAERTFRDAFAADNSPADMDAHCAASYSPDIQDRELRDPSIRTLVAETPGHALVAYAQLRGDHAPESVTGPSPIELWRFYVDRGYHGRGVAQALMARVDYEAAAMGAQTVWLGVWERNLRAQAFYRKCGFVTVGTHTFMVGSDAQTDHLMARPLERLTAP